MKQQVLLIDSHKLGYQSKLCEATDNWKEDIVSGPFGSDLLASEYQCVGIPLIRIQNIQRLEFLNKDIRYISKEKADELKRHAFQSGDLVLTKLGYPIGKTCVVPDTLKQGIVVADVVRIRISKKHCSKYFEYCLNSNVVLQQLTKGIVGSTRKRVNLNDIRNLIIPIPPKKIQEQISAKLDQQFNHIKILKTQITEQSAAAKKLFQSYIIKFFESDEIKQSKKKAFEEVTINYDEKRIPLNSTYRKDLQKIYPYYGASGIIDYVDDYIFDGRYLLIGEDGENLRSRVKPIAFLAEGKFWVNNHAHILDTQPQMLKEFLMHYINIIDLKPWVEGSAQPKLNQKNMNSIPIPVPSINIQTKLVNKIRTIQRYVEELNTQIDSRTLAINSLQESLLNKIFINSKIGSSANGNY